MRFKRSFVIKISVIFVAVICGVVFINYFKEKVELSEKTNEYFPNLFNGSRYFFRVGYPNEWAINSGANGFLIDENSGLVLEMYPLIKTQETPMPSAESTAAPETNVRDETALINIYYRPIEKDNIIDLEQALDIAMKELSESDRNIEENEISSATELETKNTKFKKVTYSYKNGTFPVKGEMYVAVRSMAYYIIIFEAENDIFAGSSFIKYKDTFYKILEDFRFSVFDH